MTDKNNKKETIKALYSTKLIKKLNWDIKDSFMVPIRTKGITGSGQLGKCHQNVIVKNCSNSTAMIDKHYSIYQHLEDMIEVLLQTDRSKQSKLKLVK